MMYFSRLKTALVIGACLLGVLFCVPNLARAPADWLPWRQIRLGLDLRGGSYLLMQIDMASVTKERLQAIGDSARTGLRKAEIAFSGLAVDSAHNQLHLHIRDADQLPAALTVINGLLDTTTSIPEFTVAQGGNNEITVTLTEAGITAREAAIISQSTDIVRRRIDATGVIDPEITPQGDDRIVVQLPGVSDPNEIKELLGRTAKLTFQMVDETANTSAAPLPEEQILPMQDTPGQKIAVYKEVIVQGGDLTNAQAGQDTSSGQWDVNITFDSTGAREFGDATAANVGKPFAMVLDDQVISAPVIQAVITDGQAQITGSFTPAYATELALLLRAGALPAPLTVVEERTVGPELGADSIRAGAISLFVGFLLVIFFMAAFYGLFGWFANIALVANLVLLMAILSLFQATLTLPGMAGILLTLGMAVDANILINERIREEVRNGKKPIQAMQTGFERAYSTIFDSNITALLAHVMLFTFGTGPVRGFALTISVGIGTTLFTATLVARLLMVRWYAATRPSVLPV